MCFVTVTIELEVVIFLYQSPVSVSRHTHTHSLTHQSPFSVWLPSKLTHWGSSRRQVWPRQLCLCLSEAAGGDSTAAQGEHPMRHVWIWSLGWRLRSGERREDRQRERARGRWVRDSEGIKSRVTDTEGERRLLHPVGFAVSSPVQYNVMFEC